MLILVVCLTLVACGGPDLDGVSAAYTKASTAFNEVATYMNENADTFGEEETSFMIEMAGALEDTKAEVEANGKDLTQEQVDEYTAWYEDVYERMEAIKEAYGIE